MHIAFISISTYMYVNMCSNNLLRNFIPNYVILYSKCLANQWLQIDVGPPTLITGVVTRGRGDTRRKQWVTRYRLSYSNDTRLWHFYKDASNIEPKVG